MKSIARIVMWTTVGLAVLYACSVIPGARVHSGHSSFWDDWVSNVQGLAAVALCGARAVRWRSERWAWSALAVALGLNLLGNLWWSLFLPNDGVVPYPSIADVFYVGFYPFAYLAIILLVRERIRDFRISMWLDGLISGLACASLSAALAFQTVVASTGGPAATVATNLAYPLGDLVLLIMVAGVFGATGWRPGRAWLLIGAAMFTYIFADTVFLYHSAKGTYAEGAWLDALWPAATALLSVAAWQRPSRVDVQLDDWRAMVVPAIGTLTAAGVLVVCALSSGRGVAVTLGATALCAGVVRTILTLRETRQLAETRVQALTDDLTGLPNRRALSQTLQDAVDRDLPFALLLVDLDRFKELNDTLGHHVGDLLLQDVGTRMAAALRPDDIVGRLGGDEFAVVLAESVAPPDAQRVAQHLHERLGRPFELQGIPVRVEASVGVAMYPAHGRTTSELLQHADVAMYDAKAGRTGVAVYTHERSRDSRDRLALLGELEQGLRRDELALLYQPKVRLLDEVVVGVEALLRWQHPTRGWLVPGDFLPAVEQTRIMRPLTEQIIAMAVAERARIDGRIVPVAVNIAAPNLLDLDFPAVVAQILDASGADPADLRLEITETAVMADADRAQDVLARLRALGVALSIDDFGTADSSLRRLITLPVDELKIDRAFVTGMCTDHRGAAIVEAAIALGRRLDLQVVAEGVEDTETLDTLRRLGCHQAQGHLLGGPVPRAELDDLLARTISGSSTPT
jgi:diguanylate cyclase (GGDEF)-like protein